MLYRPKCFFSKVRKIHIAIALNANASSSIPRRANPASYRAYKPYLRHTHDSAKDTEAESEDGSAAGGEERGGVPDGDVVDALFEDEVLG